VTDVTARDAETFTAQLADALLAVRSKECIACYVLRMLHQFGCDNTRRFALRWRDQRAPRATALERRLAQRGGCCCDCELLINVWETSEALDVWNAVLQQYEPPPRLPPCAGGRARSTEPCAHWQRRRRW
jgi:hypothetical protein